MRRQYKYAVHSKLAGCSSFVFLWCVVLLRCPVDQLLPVDEFKQLDLLVDTDTGIQRERDN